MPLIVTSGPQIEIVGLLDFYDSVLGRPEKAPCSGDFTCCRLQHSVDVGDGRMAAIPCDKTRVLPVLRQLYEARLDHFRLSNQRVMFRGLLCLGRTLFAGLQFNTSDILDENESVVEFLGRTLYTSLDDRNEMGETVLTTATMLGHPNLVRKILTLRPGFINIRNKVGFTALMFSVYRPDQHFKTILKDWGDSCFDAINAVTNNGISMLHRAAQGGFTDHVALLLKFRAIIECRRRDNGYTPLLSAARAGYVECCRSLLVHRADPDAQGLLGETALHLATDPLPWVGSIELTDKLNVARLLLSFQADDSARNAAGKTALDLSLESSFDSMISILDHHI